ncbi:probable receptor-like protein kinase At1g80640 isoform X1 [Camellia sinensis]|uniref:probable receptor-like protein kinase At1g80640 isoform X1 n=1 Tax=Camellia sinensis TaxID=4442 RepID=UPI00103581FB|nr:probable receptor-like protein kinase At1g80640 isoform X1 [Camellia sinensis]
MIVSIVLSRNTRNFMSSLKHKNITPLLGICVEDNELISVYDFLSGGNLEENLHGLLKDGWEIYANWLISEIGNSKETSVLSWELRFKPAVEIVEALNYLHNECSGPVIHRDVKSSNILLSNEFEPKVVVMTVENLHKCFNPQCICFRCYRIDCCFILLLAIPSTPYDMDGISLLCQNIVIFNCLISLQP